MIRLLLFLLFLPFRLMKLFARVALFFVKLVILPFKLLFKLIFR